MVLNAQKRTSEYSMKIKKKEWFGIIGIAVLTILGFMVHQKTPFMMDDIWYSTNLATEEPLNNLWDIIEGQIWHFNNWGGRCITHGVLQLTLMMSERGADILNVIMTLLLAYMICVTAKKKSISSYFMAFALLFAWNANMKMSMFWQAGTVNYVYSTVWILLFIQPFLDEWRDEQRKFPLISAWMLPLGICAGWSNENMGPTCFLLALATVIYCVKWKKIKVKLWMFLGTLGSFVGSILVVVAPGNFARSSTIEKKGLVETVWERFYSMLCAGTDFLFPMCLALTILILIKCVCLKGKLKNHHIVLLVSCILSYGAMVLSPHYPDRATFGTMVLGIILFIELIYDMKEEIGKKWIVFLNFIYGLYAVYILVFELVLGLKEII